MHSPVISTVAGSVVGGSIALSVTVSPLFVLLTMAGILLFGANIYALHLRFSKEGAWRQ